jgi:uncharacterized coiled-coil DUF342 family protein
MDEKTEELIAKLNQKRKEINEENLHDKAELDRCRFEYGQFKALKHHYMTLIEQCRDYTYIDKEARTITNNFFWGLLFRHAEKFGLGVALILLGLPFQLTIVVLPLIGSLSAMYYKEVLDDNIHKIDAVRKETIKGLEEEIKQVDANIMAHQTTIKELSSKTKKDNKTIDEIYDIFESMDFGATYETLKDKELVGKLMTFPNSDNSFQYQNKRIK